MTDEELKKLAKEYQKGLDEVEEARREYSARFEGLSEDEFKIEMEKQLEEILEDIRNHPIKIKTVKKEHK